MATAGDHPKLPRATLRDDKLYIEGEKEPYFRDRTNAVRLRIDALTIRRGYRDLRNRKDYLTESLGGIATVEKDEFVVIGLETDHTWPIEFDLRPIAETETEYHWHASIGFNTHEGFEWWNMPDWEEGFFMRATAQDHTWTICSQRSVEVTSITSASLWKRRCGRRPRRLCPAHRGLGVLHAMAMAEPRVRRAKPGTSRR
jgi:hypothetical protein